MIGQWTNQVIMFFLWTKTGNLLYYYMIEHIFPDVQSQEKYDRQTDSSNDYPQRHCWTPSPPNRNHELSCKVMLSFVRRLMFIILQIRTVSKGVDSLENVCRPFRLIMGSVVLYFTVVQVVCPKLPYTQANVCICVYVIGLSYTWWVPLLCWSRPSLAFSC